MESKLNNLPPVSDFESAYMLAQQAHENGFRGSTFLELWIWIKQRLDLIGLDNTAGLPEEFPAPGSTLSADSKGQWTVLTPGAYNKMTSGTIVVGENQFAFAQYDGVDYNNVRIVDFPEPVADGEIAEGDERAVSGDIVKRSYDRFLNEQKSPNILNINEAISGKYVHSSSGFSNSQGAKMTGYIPVEEGETYTIYGVASTAVGAGVANIGDASGTGNSLIIEKYPSKTFTVTEGSGVRFVLYTITSSGGDSFDNTAMMVVGDKQLPFEPFGSVYKVKETALPEAYLAESSVKSKVTSNQIWNGDYLVGKIIQQGGNSLADSSGDGTTTDKVVLEKTQTELTVDGIVSGGRIMFFDENDTFIEGSNTPLSGGRNFKAIPEGASYCYVYFKLNGQDLPTAISQLFVYYGESAKEKDEYIESVYEIDGKSILNDGNKDRISFSEERIDSRYQHSFNSKAQAQNSTKYISAINSLRKMRDGGGEIEIDIRNDEGRVVKNAIIPLTIHWGAQGHTDSRRHVFMNESCKQDFSDIRFTDLNGNMLEMVIASRGNYELIPDDRIPQIVRQDSEGNLFLSSRTSSFGILISSDNLATTTRILADGSLVFVDSNDDIFYCLGDKLYKMYKSDGYSTSNLVNTIGDSSSRIFETSFVEDDMGYLYHGCYQDGYLCKVWRSINSGETWTEILSTSNQHVHSIVLDKYTTPNTIYVNVDGSNWDPSIAPRTYKSIDRGNSWIEIDFNGEEGFPSKGFYPDYGVLIAIDGFRIGGGEGAVKGIPTIYRTSDDENFQVTLDFAQNTQKAAVNGEAIYVMGGANVSNKYIKIFRSIDKGLTWEVINDNAFEDSNTMGYSYRSGTGQEVVFPKGSEEPHLMLQCRDSPSRYVSLRAYEGGDHYQALVYVRVPELPEGWSKIKVQSGYIMDDVQGDVFVPSNNYDESLVFHLPLNEYSAKVRDIRGNTYQVGENWIGGEIKRYGWTLPVFTPAYDSAVSFDNKGVEIEAPFSKNSDFTINFWMKLDDYDSVTTATEYNRSKKFILGRIQEGNNLFISRENLQRLVLNFGVNTKVHISNVVNPDTVRIARMFTIVVTGGSSPELRVYANGALRGSKPLDGLGNTSNSSVKWNIGGFHEPVGMDEVEKSYFSDIKVFDKALNDKEVRELFEGGVVINP